MVGRHGVWGRRGGPASEGPGLRRLRTAEGALGHWIKIKDEKIASYQNADGNR